MGKDNLLLIEFPKDGLNEAEPATKFVPCSSDKANSESEKDRQMNGQLCLV